ncbi:MAG: YdeI/OmpD-associated family protein [Pseudomonadota bacterium]
MESYFTHSFETRIEKFGVGKSRVVWYRVVFMPPELEDELPFKTYPRLRIDAEIADVPANLAFMPTGDGRRYLIVSPEVLKTAGVAQGDYVTVRFRICDQTLVEAPDALLQALRHEKAAKRVWETLTPGKKRALAYHVAGAKTPPTQKRRVDEVLNALTTRDGKLR